MCPLQGASCVGFGWPLIAASKSGGRIEQGQALQVVPEGNPTFSFQAAGRRVTNKTKQDKNKQNPLNSLGV